nr:uncharacterized protein LOC124211411 [Neodiprion pinetum]
MEPHAFAYLDDIIAVTTDFRSHLKWLSRVIERIVLAGLIINPEKCVFCRSEVRYLGFKVNRDGLQVDADKVEPILAYPAPKNSKQFRRFLGMASWYRRFIPEFASVAEPLTRWLRKDKKWGWSGEQETVFERLKVALTSASVLACPDFEYEFTVQTDASSFGIGAVLTQTVGEVERVIAYASRTMSDLERKYSTTKQEFLALVALDVVGDDRPGTEHKAAWEVVVGPWYQHCVYDVLDYPNKLRTWSVVEGRLYQLRSDPLVEPILADLAPWKLVLPRGQRSQVLTEVHEDPQAGHLGVEKPYSRGTPEVLLTDNGTEFANRAVDELCAAYRITHAKVPPYHAQANPVERVNRVLKTMIVSYIEAEHRDWDVHLHEFGFTYNTAVHSSLVWGNRMAKLCELRDLVTKHLEEAHERQAKYYNQGHREIRFEVRDRVWKRNRVLSSTAQQVAAKLAPKFTDPFRVTKVISTVVYELENKERRGLGRHHIKDLKRYVESEALAHKNGEKQ